MIAGIVGGGQLARMLALAGHPNARTLAAARDRVAEKVLFHDLGIPVAPFAMVATRKDLERAAAEIGLPAVLKTRTLGYDGKGQVALRGAGELDAAWARLGGVPLILESFVPFEREVPVIAVRARDGTTLFYPLAENTHSDGILRLSLSRPGDSMQALASPVKETHDQRDLTESRVARRSSRG